jgi:hypothetical protein
LIYFFYPETQRLSLEQIDRLFTGGKVLMHWQPSMGGLEGEDLAPEEKLDGVDRVESLKETAA